MPHSLGPLRGQFVSRHITSLLAHPLGFLNAPCLVIFRKHLSSGAEKINVLTLFGTGLLISVALSILTGKTYYRRVIAKDEQPFNDWSSVGCLALCPERPPAAVLSR